MFVETQSTMRRSATRSAATSFYPDDAEPAPAALEAGETVHDLRNLLTCIRMCADLGLAQLPAESPVRTMIEQIQSACGEAGELCGTLAPATRCGPAQQRRERLDLSALVDRTVPLLAASVSRATMLKFKLCTDPTFIRADPTQIRQVLTNLALNASQALGDRPGLVVVRTGTIDLDEDDLGEMMSPIFPAVGRYAFLEVSDTGCGMDEATQARLFEPFFTTKPTGQGLGMASILRIVTAHNGAIQVRSTPGAGTRIRVLFPCEDPLQ